MCMLKPPPSKILEIFNTMSTKFIFEAAFPLTAYSQLARTENREARSLFENIPKTLKHIFSKVPALQDGTLDNFTALRVD